MLFNSMEVMDAISAGLDPQRFQVSCQSLKTLNLQIVYQADPRPTLVVDTSLVTAVRSPAIVYANGACDYHHNILSKFRDAFSFNDPFYEWVVSSNDDETHYQHKGALWFRYSLQERWRVVSQISASPSEASDAAAPLTPESRASAGGLNVENGLGTDDSIGKLKEEIRIGELSRKRAAEEENLYLQSVQQLRQKLRNLESPTPSSAMSRASSMESLRSLRPENLQAKTEDMDLSHPRSNEVRGRRPNNSRTTSRRQLSPHNPTSKVILPVRANGNNEESVALEKFQRLAEAIDVGFFDYDVNGTLLHANEAWYALSGHPRDPEQHTVLSFNQCVYPDDADLVMQQWNKLLQGQSVTFEMRWIKPAPESAGPDAPYGAQWVLSACVPVIDENGVVRSISGCTTDINAQKMGIQVAMQKAEALERARASEERFSRFAAVAPIAIFRFDKYKNIEYCNDRWFEMTGINKVPFEEIEWPFGVHEEDVSMCSEAWEQAIANRSIGQIEFRLNKDWHDDQGRRGPTWAYCTFFAEFGEDESFNGLMGSLLDISHLKWAEYTQKMRAEEALEAKRQQENFIDITSHEMRNPLSAIVQCADSILTVLADIAKQTLHTTTQDRPGEQSLIKGLIDAGTDSVQTILSCAAHQRRIVDDILTLSKLDSNLLVITPIPTNPVNMVQGVLKMFEMDSSKADVALGSEIHQSFRDMNVQWLLLDPSRVSQILINLLGNAMKFTMTEETRRVTVQMSTSVEPPSKTDREIAYVPAETIMDDLIDDAANLDSKEPIYLKFEIHDTGRGLTREEKAKLFLRFSQASPKTHVQYGGSGLGLFISRKLTEMQGGEIGFTSEADIGSTFAFYIKTWRATPPASTPRSLSPGSPAVAAQSAPPEATTRKLNILLVEDNLVNQRVLGKQLERQGCNVIVAGHGQEALSFLRTTQLWSARCKIDEADASSDPSRVDIVLMDIEMPVMGGLECTRKIREYEENKCLVRHLPIISISANARQEQVREAELAGVDDTISKPFRIKELMPKIDRLANMYT